MSFETSTLLWRAVVLVVLFGIPAGFFVLLRRRFPSVLASVHGVTTVLAMWPLLVAFRLAALPLFIADMENQNTDPEMIGMDDGVGGNAAILLFGWIPPLLSVLAMTFVARILRLYRKKPPQVRQGDS